MLPDYDNLRAAFEHAITDWDIDLAMRLVTSLPEFVHLRIGYESSGWADGSLDRGGVPSTRCSPRPSASPREGPGIAAISTVRGRLAIARGRAGPGTRQRPGRLSRRRRSPTWPCYEGDANAALAHYDAEMARARADDDPIRLVWTLFYVAICHAALRRPRADGVAAAWRRSRWPITTANPTARSMARYALGLVLKKSEPDRRWRCSTRPAELAASVQNFWWHGIALMEAASTRAVHGRSWQAPQGSRSTVLDHWDRVGDWSQQWLNLRYVTRFLVRVGAARRCACTASRARRRRQAVTVERHATGDRLATLQASR